MQAVEVSGKFEHDFIAKLKIDDEKIENEGKQIEEKVEEEDDEEEEFSFVFANPDGSLISADEVFDNGQIRPVFPVFNQDLLFSDDHDGVDGLRPPFKKVLVQHPDDYPSSSSAAASPAAGVPDGPYCEWSPQTAVKSNSTGFSKIWRLRDLKLRSNSDGKDTFVFLNPASAAKAEKPRSGEAKNAVVKKVKGKTASSAHEKHYVMNRAKKESDKRKSYLPYRQELFGFFANANGFTRNVHPY